MSQFTNNTGQFIIHRMPEEETPGSPFLCSITLSCEDNELHTISRVNKNDLLFMRKTINQALKGERP
ncbi:MAG: hypothetical protein SO360_01950 [Bifidobacterium tsurumiense]|uniref:hypothetical protein n=1 Tax=Bifidobacterium tsurumiense TaxID=356829 RepID=UPI002A82FD1F|nr:hypothetical protein [Bifidobacterium tsurumiense]MDY4677616.1 hypothetical protein [Bifidobacterium tsurumiense]